MSFQSRAGFSECLDLRTMVEQNDNQPGFNPVLGFLSVSTQSTSYNSKPESGFNPVLGFLSVST